MGLAYGRGMAPSRTRVKFVGGPLDGAVLDLPPRLADPAPGRLKVGDTGRVFDRHRGVSVQDAEVVRYPLGHPLRREE